MSHWSSQTVLFTTNRSVHRQTFGKKTYQNVLHTAVEGDKCFTYSIRSLSPLQSMSQSLKWSTGILWDLGQGVLFLWREVYPVDLPAAVFRGMRDG